MIEVRIFGILVFEEILTEWNRREAARVLNMFYILTVCGYVSTYIFQSIQGCVFNVP